ncbi:MAG: hypothetical protein JWN37_901 [Candidatus Nomurabacteria bacterium]|nr:hypothetical protein [Candidatus Nomurabacteria bacterium]
MFRYSFIIASFAVIAQLLGILRDRLLAQNVGVGQLLDIYNASFRIPDLALGIMLSFAAAGTVIPFISKSISSNNKEELSMRFNSLFYFFGMMMIIICGIVFVTLPFYASFFVPGFTPDQTDKYIFFTRILLIQPILLGFSSLISCLAQARNEFLLFCTAPLIYTVSIIISIITLYPHMGLLGIIIGVVIGAALHLGLQSFTFIKHPIKITRKHFSIGFVKEHLHISVPRSGSFIINQIRVLFFTGFATLFGAGALTVYLFAQKIIDAGLTVISQSFSSGSLPRLADHIDRGDIVGFKKTFFHNAGLVFILAILFAGFCYYFPHLVVNLLYGKTPRNVDIITILRLIIISMPLHALGWYTIAAFNATKDTKSIFYSNIVSTAIAVGVCFYYKSQGLGLISLAYGIISMNISFIVCLLFFFQRKRLK